MFEDTLIGRMYADEEMEYIDIMIDVKEGKIDLYSKPLPRKYVLRMMDDLNDSYQEALQYNLDNLSYDD